MKHYRRKIPIFPPRKLTIVAACLAAAAGVIALIFGADNPHVFLCGAFSVAVFSIAIFSRLGADGQYCYCDNYIKVFYLLIFRRKRYYSQYKTIIISYAAYNDNFGTYSIPMQYKCKTRNGRSRITFPYMTLLGPEYPLDRITADVDNHNFRTLHDDCLCLGICWFDSLEELLTHTSYDVYILEDVYFTYRGKFDGIIYRSEALQKRFHIICNRFVN